jgi:hypothetical protein
MAATRAALAGRPRVRRRRSRARMAGFQEVALRAAIYAIVRTAKRRRQSPGGRGGRRCTSRGSRRPWSARRAISSASSRPVFARRQ